MKAHEHHAVTVLDEQQVPQRALRRSQSVRSHSASSLLFLSSALHNNMQMSNYANQVMTSFSNFLLRS